LKASDVLREEEVRGPASTEGSIPLTEWLPAVRFISVTGHPRSRCLSLWYLLLGVADERCDLLGHLAPVADDDQRHVLLPQVLARNFGDLLGRDVVNLAHVIRQVALR